MIPGFLKLATGFLLTLTLAGCGGAGAAPTPPASGSHAFPSVIRVGTTSAPGAPASPGTPAGGPSAAIDSCAVLTDEEIEAATGQNVTERSISNLRPDVFPSICDIELDGGGSLTVSVRASGGRSMYETSFEPFIGEDDFSLLHEKVTGLGDKAGSGDDELMVLKDDVLFDVTYFEFGRPNGPDVVRYLAERILARLPCLAAGCPGMTVPPPPSLAPTVDVCALLTEAEIQNETGLKTLETIPAAGFEVGCMWTLDTEPFPGADYIELNVQDTGGREQFRLYAEEYYETDPEHVPGLGDDAVKTATIPGGYIYTVVGDRLITARFSLPLSVDDPYALVVPLVEIALSRLDDE